MRNGKKTKNALFLLLKKLLHFPARGSSPPWKPTHLFMAVGIDKRGTRDRPTRVKPAQTRQRPHSLKGAKVGQNKQALPPLEPGVGSCSRRGPPGPPGPRPPQAPCGTTALRTQSRPPCGLAQLPPAGRWATEPGPPAAGWRRPRGRRVLRGWRRPRGWRRRAPGLPPARPPPSVAIATESRLAPAGPMGRREGRWRPLAPEGACRRRRKRGRSAAGCVCVRRAAAALRVASPAGIQAAAAPPPPPGEGPGPFSARAPPRPASPLLPPPLGPRGSVRGRPPRPAPPLPPPPGRRSPAAGRGVGGRSRPRGLPPALRGRVLPPSSPAPSNGVTLPRLPLRSPGGRRRLLPRRPALPRPQ